MGYILAKDPNIWFVLTNVVSCRELINAITRHPMAILKHYSQLINCTKTLLLSYSYTETYNFFNIIIISQDRVKIRESKIKKIKNWQFVKFVVLVWRSSYMNDTIHSAAFLC